MSDEFHLRRGAHMRRKGGLWKVTKFDNGRILIKNLDTDEPDELTLEAWRTGCHEGEIEMVGARRAGLVDRQQLRSGSYMRRKDALWRVRLVKDGVIHLEDVRTDETDRLRVEEWRRGCYEGAIEMAADPNTDLPEAVRELLLVPLMNQPESMRIATLDAAVFVLAYRDPLAFYERKLPEVKPDARHLPVHLSKRWIQPFLAEVARACGKRRPGFSTFCKWLQKVDLANGDIRALAPRYDRRGPHHRYMDPRVEQWLNDCIDGEWLNSNRNDKKKVHEALEAKIGGWNAANPGRPLRLPSQGHVNRYIRETVDRYTAARRRYGKEYADRLFKQVGEGPKTTFAFERVEVDHTETDLPVCHDETHVYLGRPWITTALDHYSRMPLAIHVHFEGGTSLTAVFQCLHNLMSPKGFLRKLVPEVDYDYPWGVPVGFFFDHGSDFDNPHVRAVGATFSIRIDHSPAECPYYKGAIERFWRTVHQDVEYPVAGAMRPIKQDGVVRDEQGKAYITFSEFVRRLWRWVATVYAKSYHRGIEDVPLRRLQESLAQRLPRAPRKKDDLNILLNRIEWLTPSHKGVVWNGLRWNGHALRQVMSHPDFRAPARGREGTKVQVRIDDKDLANAWAINPFTGREERLEPVLKDYMPGLTLHQHEVSVRNHGKVVKGTIFEKGLVVQKTRLREEAHATLSRQRAGQRSNANAAKSAGIGLRAPAGDELNGIKPDPSLAEPGAVTASVPAGERVRAETQSESQQEPASRQEQVEAPAPERASKARRFRNS